MDTHAHARSRAHRWLGAALVAALAAATLTAPPAAQAATGPACEQAPLDRQFDDVAADGPFADAIDCVTGYGIASGDGNGQFRPGSPVTRGEAAALVVGLVELADGAQLPDAVSNPFEDLRWSGPFAREVLRLVRAGVVEGRTSTRFGGGDPLTRGQMTTIVAGALRELGLALDDSDVDYPDVPDDGLFATPVSQLTNAGIVGGFPDGRFRPQAKVTRGELAGFLAGSAEFAARRAAFLPTGGSTITSDDWTTLRGSLRHARVSYRAPSDGAPQVVNVLRWDLDDPQVQLSADYAGGATGRASMVQAARREGVVAAVNGGFWNAGNDPNGLLVTDGRMVSDPSVWNRWTSDDRDVRMQQYRSAFGLHSDGTARVGRVDWQATVTTSTGATLDVDAINRSSWGTNRDRGALYLTRNAAAKQVDEQGYYFVLDGVANLNRSGSTELTIAEEPRRNSRGPVSISSGQSAVFVPTANAEGKPLGGLRLGDTITVDVGVDPEWEGLRTGMAGGPLLLENNNATRENHWHNVEVFDPDHTGDRHPRTAIGFTGDGRGMIVTVDGRQPGASNGMRVGEMINYLRGQLGVRDAVMMDGGGSTQMVVIDGQLANRPCCDWSLRTVATGMFFEAR